LAERYLIVRNGCPTALSLCQTLRSAYLNADWLKPQLVAQIEYADDDKVAKDVRREQPVG